MMRGMSLIELVIVMAVMGILLALAVPGYSSYMLRVHRAEAVRMLLQAAICQERIYAGYGAYDTSQCHTVSQHHRYEIAYSASNFKGHSYVALARPLGPQLQDPCGSLLLDQNGDRRISAVNISAAKCWNAR
jgi:type IV pilus assembly protein PilE